MIITEKRIKRQAELVESKFKIDHSESLEFVAKLNGFKDWDHYTKELKINNNKKQPEFSLGSVCFTMNDMYQLAHSVYSSFLTDQLDRFDLLFSELDIDTILKLDDKKTCSFYYTDDFLKAKILEGYFKSQGKQTALFYDTASFDTQDNDFIVWVTIPLSYFTNAMSANPC
jgi:hypothetical protein